MMLVCRCASCKKELGCAVEGFDGKNVWITLSFKRHHSMCNECKHMDSVNYDLYFCGIQCLKDYVIDPECLDAYVADEVFWGKMFRENPHLKPV